jgi:hypothetical protein
MPSQQFKVGTVLPAVNDRATWDWLSQPQHLDTGGLPMRAITVTSGGAVRANTQFVEIHLTAKSVKDANDVLSKLITSLRKNIDEANQVSGTHIAVLRLKVLGANGEPLFHFIRDMDIGTDVFSYADGIDAGYPSPAQTSTPISPLTSPQPTPTK